MKTLTIYSKANCPFCDQAKRLLDLKDISYTEVRVDLDPSAKEFIVSEGHRTVPQIYLDGKLFVEGGFTGLKNLNEEELFSRLSLND